MVRSCVLPRGYEVPYGPPLRGHSLLTNHALFTNHAPLINHAPLTDHGRSDDPMRVIVLTGFAGAGKTALLAELADAGEQVLDLEALAAHRGSSFGRIGIAAPQPNQREFHAHVLASWAALDPARRVWIEDEGPHIGRLWLPDQVTDAIASGETVRVEASLDDRVADLAALYGRADPAELIDATQRIRRRLGNRPTDRAISHFHARRPDAAIRVLLEYFDAGYARRAASDTRRRLVPRDLPAVVAARNADDGICGVRDRASGLRSD